MKLLLSVFAQLSSENRLKGWLLLALVISLLLIMLVVSFTLLRRWRINSQRELTWVRRGQEPEKVDPWQESARRMETPDDDDADEDEEDDPEAGR